MTLQLKNSRYVGESIARVEDYRLLTGKGCFVDDIHLPNEASAVILRSQIAHGRVKSIDASAALELPGVYAVLTAHDIEGDIPRIPFRIAPFEEAVPFQQPVIACDRVRYVGEPLAVVVAKSAAIAEDACELIQVEIEEITPVATTRHALNGSTVLHPDAASNIAYRYVATRGDIAAAFANATYTRKETFLIHRHTAVPMEMRGLLANWDCQAQHLTVWGAAKVSFFNRNVLARMIGLPSEQIDLIEVDIGGGFGVRGEFYPEDFLIPFAAWRVGHPVRWSEDRREHLMATNHSRETEIELEIACSGEGKILGLRGRVLADLGAYVGTTGGILASRGAQFLPGPFDITAIEIEALSIVSNKTPSGSYRGPGRFESCFARERLFDMAARELGIEAIDFRRNNLLRPEQLPYETGTMVPYEPTGSFDHADHFAVLERCVAEIDLEKKASLRGKEVEGRYHGIGFASFIDSSGAGPKENCKVQIEQDGKVTVSIGSSALGQGIVTAFSQICADELEIPLERIRVFHGSTNILDEGFGSYHSRSMIMGGNALVDAVNNLKTILRETAARIIGCPVEIIRYASGQLIAEGYEPILLETLAAQVGSELAASGTFGTGRKPYGYGTHAAHVAVDIRTGHVDLIDYVAVEDVGKMINPLLVHGQKIGAIVQGLGGTFLEHLVYDENGQFLSGSLADYLLPTSTDFPNIRAIALDLVRTDRNPLMVKGVGEDAIAPVAGAIGNAIADALRHLNIQPRALPLTPYALWQAIQDRKVSDHSSYQVGE